MSDKHVHKRLAFIKYLYKSAVDNSKKPQPACSMSLLIFHDAMESFLKLISEYLDAGRSNLSFMDYWEVLNRELPEETTLGHKESSRRLNKARVNLKHHGNMPSKTAIESYRSTATNFLEDNSKEVFDVDFSKLSMVRLINDSEIKNHLKNAEESLGEEKFENSIQESSIAFHLTMKKFFGAEEGQYSTRGSNIPLPFPPSFRKDDILGIGNELRIRDPNEASYSSKKRWNSAANYFREIIRTITSIQEVLGVMALGIDYQEYNKFKKLTPGVLEREGEYQIIANSDHNSNELNHQNAKFCIDFVIENVLEFQTT